MILLYFLPALGHMGSFVVELVLSHKPMCGKALMAISERDVEKESDQ